MFQTAARLGLALATLTAPLAMAQGDVPPRPEAYCSVKVETPALYAGQYFLQLGTLADPAALSTTGQLSWSNLGSDIIGDRGIYTVACSRQTSAVTLEDAVYQYQIDWTCTEQSAEPAKFVARVVDATRRTDGQTLKYIELAVLQSNNRAVLATGSCFK